MKNISPAGKRAFPKHAHFANEEMFFVLEGEGVFHLGDEEYPIRKGDFIAAPPNPNMAHQIVNTSDKDLVYLCVSTMIEPEVAYYPDSDKIGVLAGNAPGRTTKPGIQKSSKLIRMWVIGRMKHKRPNNYWFQVLLYPTQMTTSNMYVPI